MFRTPIELIKCRMQVQMLAGDSALASATGDVIVKTTLEAPAQPSSTVVLPAKLARATASAPKGPFALIADTVRTSGIKGLWLGNTGTLVRETGGGVAWFGAYELLARYFVQQHQMRAPAGYVSTKSDLTAWQLMVAGAAGGVSYVVSLFPADSIKSTMQTYAELNPGKQVPGFLQTGRDIWKARGIRGLYAGCGLTCLKSGPSSAMIFAIFETLKTHLGWVFVAPEQTPPALA